MRPARPMADYASAVEGLRDKYVELLALRQERERAQAEGLERFPAAEAERRRAAMRAVASRFPGALRELDLLDAETLASRLARCEAELARITAGDAPSDALLGCMADYHRFMKQALRVRRRLSASELTADALQNLRERESRLRALEPGWTEHELDDALLHALARPVGGRIQPLVLEAVATKHGLDPDALERLLFPRGTGRAIRH